MRLSKKSQYALRALTRLAMAPKRGHVQAHELARSEHIPGKFLEHILLVLTNARILQSRRGVGGGYTLNRGPDQITLGEVICLMEGALSLFSCHDETAGGCCSWAESGEDCGLCGLMGELGAGFSRALEATTLADVCARTRDLQRQRAATGTYDI